MNRQVAFAYAIAGLAVAVALVAVVGSSVGLFETRSPAPAAAEPAQPPAGAVTPAPRTPAASPDAAEPVLVSAGGVDPGAEVVYVDAPARAGARHDDDDEHERGEHHRRGRHHEDDDD